MLSDPFSEGPGDRDMVFVRLSALVDSETRRADWPADDFAGWLDNLPDGVATSDREVAVLGGLDATRVDLGSSGDSTSRVRFGTTGSTSHFLNAGSKYRIWVVEQDGEAPLAVIVAIVDELHSGWFDVADELLSTIEFGDIAPNPASWGSRRGNSSDPGALRAPLLRWPEVSLDAS